MKLSRIRLIPVLCILIPAILWLLSGRVLFNFLSLHKPEPEADILIVEGWLHDDELNFVSKIIREHAWKTIITTGVEFPEFFMMDKNGDLLFYPDTFIEEDHPVVSVNAYSTKVNDAHAEFEVYINNQLLGKGTASIKPSLYSFRFTKSQKIDSLAIRFLNDAVRNGEDRNLFISFVKIGHTLFPVNSSGAKYKVNPGYDHGIFDLYETNAQRARMTLIMYGISPERIIAIDTYHTNHSKTFDTAKETLSRADAILKEKEYIINVVSRHPHTRRTYMAYKRHLGGKGRIGIIATPSFVCKSGKNNRIQNLRELIGILFIAGNPGL